MFEISKIWNSTIFEVMKFIDFRLFETFGMKFKNFQSYGIVKFSKLWNSWIFEIWNFQNLSLKLWNFRNYPIFKIEKFSKIWNF